MTLTQPDGSVLHCFASGDEYFNFLHDNNGYTIIQHPETGYYVYAEKREGKLVATNYVAGVYDPASKGLEPYTLISPEEWMARRQARQMPDKRPQNRDANHGTLNNLSIFIRFADDPEFTNSYSSIDNMFNDVSENAVSMRSYFRAASYGAIEIPTTFYPEHNGDAIISYQDIYPRSYYRPYNSTTNPDGYNNDNESREREFSLLERAVNYVNANYPVPSDLNIDYDDDGNVDNVCFIVKGNVDSWTSLIWPHQWYIFDRTVLINGKRVYTFNFQLADANDYFNTSVMCHEMNHSLGAPDLYHYDYGQFIKPVGPWDLMESNATPPQHCGAYMKMKYGHWIDEIPEITQSGIYTLNPISSATPTNIAYKIQSSDPNQYYVLEYRENTSLFETSLPGSGLLVYRIDTRFDGNADYNPYMNIYDEIYIFRPGGTTSANGNLNAAYFSADVGRTEFNASTNPRPFLTNGTIDNELKIYNITSAGNTISFSYGSGCEPPTHLVATVEDNNVTLSWDAATNAVSYNVFRNGTLVGNTSETMYLDSELGSGFYNYYLRSIDANGIPSDPSETVTVSVMVENGILVGDGGLATNSFLPSNSYYNYSLTQQIYTADEIGEAGVITGMAFYLDGAGKTRTFDIYMKSTTKSAFSSAADWETVSNTNKVFSGIVTLAANAWTLITFDIPYIHDGTSNIVLVTDDNTGSYSSTMSCRVFDAPNQAISVFSDDQNYNPTTLQTSYYEDAELLSVKNQIILTKEAIPTSTYNITVSANPAEAGTVSGGGVYGFGETCTVSASPIDGYSFVNWTQNGEVVSTEASYSFIVYNDMNLVANFSETLYVTVSVNPAESGTVSGAGAYGYGNTCTLIATPAEGYYFLNWTQDGEVISTDATYSFTVDSDTELVANFSEGLLIGDGGSATDLNLPSNNYYSHSLSQQIYTAEELGSAGLITSIAFFNDGAEKTRTCDFYIKATEKTTFSDYGDWEKVFAGDKVFSGSVTFETGVWTVLTLTTPFYYDGMSNIVLVADDNSNTYTNAPHMKCRVFDANRQAIFVHSDGTDYDPTTPFSYDGNVLSVKNQIIITKEFPSMESVNITVNASPAHGGMVTGGGVYNFGETCTITATVNAGYFFIGWMENGELVTKDLEYSFSAVRDRDLVATFSKGILIGDGGTDTDMTLPNYSGFSYSLSQQIYTADEIGTAGTINSIAFFNDGIQRTRSYDMYLVHTNKNAFESTDDWIAVTEADKVFSGSVIMVSGDWTYITFDTPFEYDGMSNLALVMDDNTNASHFGIAFRIFETEDNQAIRVYSDNVNYNPMEPPTPSVSSDHPGILPIKNQIILIMSEDEMTQETDFTQGWNWWSTYIEQEGMDGLSLLEESLGDHGITIWSQVGYTDYYTDYGWYGSLTSINNESSYKIKTDVPCSVAMTGMEAVPSQHPIALSHGWSWMGYVPSTAMDVNEALSGLDATEGDRLKSQLGYADYYQSYGWYGSLNTIEPGMGLMYYSSNGETVTFTYPDNNRGRALKANLTSENNHWKPNVHAYPDNMTVMAVVELDDEELNTEQYELAAFAANGECRGSVKLTYAEPLNRYVAFLTISGKDAAELSFRLYNAETNEEYYDAEESLDFVANAIVGKATDLYVIHFKGATGMNEFASKVRVYPNPVKRGEQFSIGLTNDMTSPVHVEIINTLGVVVESLRITSCQALTAPNVAGVYMLRLIDGNNVKTQKIVVE
jgi:M6 family metalloprotease-like protein